MPTSEVQIEMWAAPEAIDANGLATASEMLRPAGGVATYVLDPARSRGGVLDPTGLQPTVDLVVEVSGWVVGAVATSALGTYLHDALNRLATDGRERTLRLRIDLADGKGTIDIRLQLPMSRKVADALNELLEATGTAPVSRHV
jgi:hypothetical protein